MPQEINKENVTANVLAMYALAKRHRDTIVDAESTLRTNEQICFNRGEYSASTSYLLLWTHTAELFGIELPED